MIPASLIVGTSSAGHRALAGPGWVIDGSFFRGGGGSDKKTDKKTDRQTDRHKPLSHQAEHSRHSVVPEEGGVEVNPVYPFSAAAAAVEATSVGSTVNLMACTADFVRR